MSDHEKRAAILSKQYEFWMGIKSALGMAPSWKKAPSPSDSCSGGYSTNKILHNSRECFQERLDNIKDGWKTQDALLFASMLFSIPVTVFIIWGWCGTLLVMFVHMFIDAWTSHCETIDFMCGDMVRALV